MIKLHPAFLHSCLRPVLQGNSLAAVSLKLLDWV